MKRFALLLSSVAFVTPAMAADVIFEEPPAPAPVVLEAPVALWTGFYVGGQAGVAFTDDNDAQDITFDPDFDGARDVFGEDENAGFIGGVHVGYDQQINNFVIGAQVDISWLDAEVNRDFRFTNTTGGAVFNYNYSREIDWFGTARLKAGVAADRFMVYATGGLAYANLESGVSAATIAGRSYVFENDDNDDFGYTVGAGVDFLVSNNFSLGLEYLYTDLGEDDHSFQTWETVGGTRTLVNSGNIDTEVDFHTVWAKASFRFN